MPRFRVQYDVIVPCERYLDAENREDVIKIIKLDPDPQGYGLPFLSEVGPEISTEVAE